MREYAIPPWDNPALPVRGGAALFPVRRIYCVGRNYAAPAREMGHDGVAAIQRGDGLEDLTITVP